MLINLIQKKDVPLHQIEILKDAKAAEESLAREEAAAWKELEKRIAEYLEEGHPCLALGALASSGRGERARGMELNRKARLAADSILSQGLALHRKALEDGDYDGSRQAIAILRDGLQSSDGGLATPWSQEILEADEEGERHFVSLKGAAFQTDRMRLIATLSGGISRGLETLDLSAGTREWAEACGAMGHSGLEDLASRETPFFKLAARGADAVILGCTELPLAIPERRHEGTPFVNSTRALARALIRATHPEKLRFARTVAA